MMPWVSDAQMILPSRELGNQEGIKTAGTQLSAETLKQRENEALFYEGQAALRQESARLRNLQINVSNIELVTVDQQAVDPVGSIKPRRGMILILSVVLVQIAFLLTAYRW